MIEGDSSYYEISLILKRILKHGENLRLLIPAVVTDVVERGLSTD